MPQGNNGSIRRNPLWRTRRRCSGDVTTVRCANAPRVPPSSYSSVLIGALGQIDAMSENSDRETKTQTEQAFNQAFFKQIGDIGLIVTAVMSAVFFTLLLLAGNTMAQAVRERIPELAVLKTIGFSNGSVLWLVLMESIILIVIGGAIGLAIATLLMPAVSAASGGAIQLGTVPPVTWLLGLALMVGLGIIVGAQPALRAMRLNIVDALADR